MSRKRYLSTNISVDPRVRDLAEHNGEFAALLYTWMIPHADDEGLISANADELILQVIPGFRWRTVAEVDAAVAAMVESGLVERVDGQRLRFPLGPFYKYQAYIGPSRRATPEPEPTQPPNGTSGDTASAQISANQRNAPDSAQIATTRARAPSSSSVSSSFSGSFSSSPPAASQQPPATEFTDAERVVVDAVGVALAPFGFELEPRMWRKVLDSYRGIDLEAEAYKQADWLRHHRIRNCSAARYTNWLSKACTNVTPIRRAHGLDEALVEQMNQTFSHIGESA